MLSTRAGILRLALEVLLPVALPDRGLGGHDDARLGAVDARLARSPQCDTDSPFSYSFVSSPRYQTLPARSCAYQS